MILIGSSAIKYWYPDFHRELKNIDIVHCGLSSEDHCPEVKPKQKTITVYE